MPGEAKKKAVSKKISEQTEKSQLSSLLGPEALNLLNGRGVDLIQQVGLDVVRDIIILHGGLGL